MNIIIKPLKHFYCPTKPSHDDIEYVLNLVNKEDCYVQINYTVFGYEYDLLVCPGDTHEEIFNRLPKMYGL